MNDNYDFLVVSIVIIGFIAGYLILSFLVKKVKSHFKSTGNSQDKKNNGTNQTGRQHNNKGFGYSGQHEDYSSQNEHERNRRGFYKSGTDLEKEYSEILGLKYRASFDEIKKQYRNLIAKYHPDKVSHLGLEFQKIAAEKTKAINKAYEFFQRKHNM